MNKKVLRDALIDSCIRLLNRMSNFIGPQPDEESYQTMLRNIRDVAATLDSLKKDLSFIPLQTEVMTEALAYECKKQQPDPEVIIDLTLFLQK